MANDFERGFRDAVRREIAVWSERMWENAIHHNYERERFGDDREFDRGPGMSFWHRAHYQRAQIERLAKLEVPHG